MGMGEPQGGTRRGLRALADASLACLCTLSLLGAGQAFALGQAALAQASAPRAEPAPALGHGHPHDRPPESAEARATRQALLQQAEAALAQGDAAAALRGFEQAAQSAHEADIELGILRAQMQLGDYRHALAFAAHTAGVHLDEVEGRVFYAWLLNLGAQAGMADRTLRQAEAVAPQHPLVQAVRQSWAQGWVPGTAPMRQAPARLAPYAWGQAVPEGVRVVATATLLADGVHALVPRSACPAAAEPGTVSGDGAPRLWLRNGLGQTVSARLQDSDEALGLALLRTDGPLPVPADARTTPRDAFAGSPLYAFDHAVDPVSATAAPRAVTALPGQPAWPLMRPGFLGRDALGVDWPAGAGAPSAESAEGPAAPRGGPVLDAGGRLIGVAQRAVRHGQAADRLVPISALRQRFGELMGPLDATSRAPTIDADAAFERGLRLSLQVLGTAP